MLFAILMMTITILCLAVLVELQHSVLQDQKRVMARQMAVIDEQDSIMGELCFQRDSLQIIVGVDND